MCNIGTKYSYNIRSLYASIKEEKKKKKNNDPKGWQKWSIISNVLVLVNRCVFKWFDIGSTSEYM